MPAKGPVWPLPAPPALRASPWLFPLGVLAALMTAGLPLASALLSIPRTPDAELGGPEPGLADVLAVESPATLTLVGLAALIVGLVLYLGVRRAARRGRACTTWPLAAVASLAWLVVIPALGGGLLALLIVATAGLAAVPVVVGLVVVTAPGTFVATWLVLRVAAQSSGASRSR